jgi:hypothetical protein
MTAEVDPVQWAIFDHMPLNEVTKAMIVSTINGSFRDVVQVYVKHFCGKTDALNAQIVQIDEDKFKLSYFDTEDLANMEEKTINYQNSTGAAVRARRTGEVRRILFEMAMVASQATGDDLVLPKVGSYGSQELDKVPGAYLLNDVIDMSTLECLNQDSTHPVTNAVRNSFSEVAEGMDAESWLQSDPDVDHQLLIKVGFQLPVKLQAITVRGKIEDETAPQSVKVFQGFMSIGFQEAEDQEAVQSLELTESHVEAGDPCLLRMTKFQNVTTLQLFFDNNFGADVTRIDNIEFWGSVVETVDMRAWKPVTKATANPYFRDTQPQGEPLDPF